MDNPNKTIDEITIVPLGTVSTSLSQYVADIENILKKYKDLKCELTPMSTIVEGKLDRILEAVREIVINMILLMRLTPQTRALLR